MACCFTGTVVLAETVLRKKASWYLLVAFFLNRCHWVISAERGVDMMEMSDFWGPSPATGKKYNTRSIHRRTSYNIIDSKKLNSLQAKSSTWIEDFPAVDHRRYVSHVHGDCTDDFVESGWQKEPCCAQKQCKTQRYEYKTIFTHTHNRRRNIMARYFISTHVVFDLQLTIDHISLKQQGKNQVGKNQKLMGEIGK